MARELSRRAALENVGVKPTIDRSLIAGQRNIFDAAEQNRVAKSQRPPLCCAISAFNCQSPITRCKNAGARPRANGSS